MKLKINKASDLSSISVLPPQSRRSNAVSGGLESSSVFGRSQAVSQLRPQQSLLSQPSLSQGVSSQHGLFSQFSQNSQDEPLIYEKNGSQERENSVRRASCLPHVSYSRNESQIIGSMTSNNLMQKYKCQISEELEHRLVMIETSLSRLGMILDSVQNDIIQVNKGTKEVALEMEGFRQKLIVHDDKLQTTIKGQEDLKTRVDMGMKSLLDQLKLNISQGNSGDLMSMLSALSEKIDAQMVKLHCDLSNDFGKEVQAIACSMKFNKQQAESALECRKASSSRVPPKEVHLLKNITIQPIGFQEHLPPNVETRGWISVKQERTAFKDGNRSRGRNQESSFVVDSDEDINGGFSCLLEEPDTETYNCSMEDVKEETARILKKARRKKRKHSNTIVID